MAKTTEIETSLTLDYRRLAWGIERIVLDSISNHLPEDSKGTITSVKLKQDGKYIELKDADKSKPTDEVVFEDNGSGYDAGLLSVLFSPKGLGGLSVGQFGEGLKMVAAAALRENLGVEYRSRNWRAAPYVKKEWIGGQEIERLCFRVVENGDQLNGSRTVFTNPSQEFMEEIFKIPEKVLPMSTSYEELYISGTNPTSIKWLIDFKFSGQNESAGYKSRIIDTKNGKSQIYIKGIKVQDAHSIFSYDLGISDISPDRIFADRDKLLDSVGNILKECNNTQVIERILLEAEVNPSAYYFEFEAFKNRKFHTDLTDHLYKFKEKEIDSSKTNLIHKFHKFPEKENLWVSTFKRLYGENAVIESLDTNANADAKLMGYNPIKLTDSIANYLMENGVLNASKIKNESEYKWVDIGELTESETDIIEKVKEINQVILGRQVDINLKVYSGLFKKSGREIESVLGVCNQDETDSYIGIKRSQLQSLDSFVHTYIHELGHKVTGKGDFEREFVDFFVKACAKMTIYYMNQGNPVLNH